MSTALVAGALLAADAGDRQLRYLLLPYGEPGRTNLGRLTASRGRLTIPDRITANTDHDPKRPVAYADRADIVETDHGLEATFTVLPTTAGNDLLVEARSGLRAGISVEVDPIVIRRGELISGQLTGAGFTATPAFASAGLVAEDAGDLPDEEGQVLVVDGVEYVRKTTDPATPAAGEDEDDPDQEDPTVPTSALPAAPAPATATAPAGGLAAARAATAAGAALRATGPSINELTKLMATAHTAGGARGLMAALSDIIPADILGIEQPQYVGELWDGVPYERRFVPLFNHADLTSWTVTGWRWVTKPVVAPYTGNKTAVPSNTVETEPQTISAERLAGAHDIDRKFRDFNDQEFFDAYFRAMAESYARVSDLAVIADALAAAPVVEAGTVPTDVPDGLAYIVDGALAILEATDTLPTFALVAPPLWRDMVLSPTDHGLEYLTTTLGLKDGNLEGFTLMPTAAAPLDGVLVGNRAAMTVHELAGSPIRVEAIDVANGGIDSGLFGYYATNLHDATGLAAVTAPTP